jgi:quinol monooxygenase YgiN
VVAANRCSTCQEHDMGTLQTLTLGASVPASPLDGSATAEGTPDRYVRMAEVEIDLAQLEAYKGAVKEEIEASVRVEPGVLALYAVSTRENPTHVRILEIYADEAAYKAHLETPHFKKYKATTQDMVKHLNLIETVPIMLGAKVK